MTRIGALALGLALTGLTAAPAGAAQTVVVQGLDTLTWDKTTVDIQPGDSVRWTFAGTTQAHNVRSNSPNWSERSTLGPIPAPDFERPFDQVGEYAFICEVHSGMTGVVRVSTAPPPPPAPIPLSAQPFANDSTSVLPAETAVTLDKTPPALASVSARRLSKGARVRFKVSEESVVSVRVKRAGRAVKTASASGTGTRSVMVRGLKAGRYQVQVQATDLAGNRSKLRTVGVTVR